MKACACGGKLYRHGIKRFDDGSINVRLYCSTCKTTEYIYMAEPPRKFPIALNRAHKAHRAGIIECR